MCRYLCLSTGIGAALFALKDTKYSVLLAIFGIAVGCLWLVTNLGSKFWQSRWEYRLRLAEQTLQPNLDLHSASWQTVQDDVQRSLSFRKRGRLHSFYGRLVMMKPSVSLMMTLLSLLFIVFWCAVLAVTFVGTGYTG